MGVGGWIGSWVGMKWNVDETSGQMYVGTYYNANTSMDSIQVVVDI